MYTTYAFARNLFDEIADSAFGNHNTTGLMNTDIRETEKGFEMAIDLPGVEKENVNAELKDGYLNLSAKHSEDKEDKDKDGKVLRQERYYGNVARSFFVGKDLKQEDVHARYDNGILEITFPKEDAREKIPENHTIAIEG